MGLLEPWGSSIVRPVFVIVIIILVMLCTCIPATLKGCAKKSVHIIVKHNVKSETVESPVFQHQKR